MTENEKEGVTESKETLQYAFLVFKTVDGDYGVKPVDELPKTKTPDDIYSACSAILRQLDAQLTAVAVGNALQAAVLQQQVMRQQGQRTKGGIVVPGDIEVNNG